MSEPTQEEVISVVSSVFEIKSVNQNLDALQFEIEQEGFKPKFVKLAQSLEPINCICRLERSSEGRLYILVNRLLPITTKSRRIPKSWIPRILFAIVIAFTMIDGYYRTIGANSLVYVGEPLEMAGLYTLSLLGILGVHESGHLIAAKLHKIRTSWPYFIPGIPVFGIPTFGAFIQSRGLTINRDILFDIAIAGPIAGFVIAVIVSIYGAYTSPLIDGHIAANLFEKSELVKMNENILITMILAIFGKAGEGTEVIMTPVLFAGWLGFLITFLNLLPAWQLDGGHIARTLFGQKWHKIATYASMIVLAALGYYIMALFILLMSSRNQGAMPLDDISPLSSSRKKMYLVVIVLAVLCAPLP